MNSKLVRTIQDFSLPLIAGVVAALFFANAFPDFYDHLVHDFLGDVVIVDRDIDAITGHELQHSGVEDVSHADAHQVAPNGSDGHGHHAEEGSHHPEGWQYFFTLHFLVNDIFMVLFFGLAAKEITESFLPGGPLNKVSKAINPLLGTLGGILGPVFLFLGLNYFLGQSEWYRGWGIPTATDIAIAWLGARLIFGKGHPAISFLLLLAVADDAIGLGIIAIAYPDPNHPTLWLNALWILPGMLSAFTFRKLNVQSWLPYILIGGAFCWWGLYSAHLHPALTLVFVVPFLPGPKTDKGLYLSEVGKHAHHSTLERFEEDIKLFVDYGLFFFGFANAGVSFGEINTLTWLLATSLILGKTIGITAFSWVGSLVGCKLPDGMNNRHLVVASAISGIGLTVALFVSGQAFVDPATQGAAKMGALFSVFAFGFAYMIAKVLRVSKQPPSNDGDSHVDEELELPEQEITSISELGNECDEPRELVHS